MSVYPDLDQIALNIRATTDLKVLLSYLNLCTRTLSKFQLNYVKRALTRV